MLQNPDFGPILTTSPTPCWCCILSCQTCHSNGVVAVMKVSTIPEKELCKERRLIGNTWEKSLRQNTSFQIASRAAFASCNNQRKGLMIYCGFSRYALITFLEGHLKRKCVPSTFAHISIWRIISDVVYHSCGKIGKCKQEKPSKGRRVYRARERMVTWFTEFL